MRVCSVRLREQVLEMQEFIKGLVIGVGAVVTTAIILGVYRWLLRCRDRREQIPYIRDLISNQMTKILSANDVPPRESGMKPIPADCVRFIFFVNSRVLCLLHYRHEQQH